MLQHMLGSLAPEQARKLPGTLSFTTHDDSLQAVFEQLAQALSALSNAADVMLANSQREFNTQQLAAWLRPHARAAEEAMHRLRDLHGSPSSTLTELSQCLTILVLAADMLGAGQLSASDANECYALLRRNADRAIAGLYDIHSYLSVNRSA